MFIEKPVFEKIEVSLEALQLKKESVYYVACPLRYTGVIQYFKHQVDLNKVLCVRVICSSYLPEWRPGQDYRNTYSAHKDQGWRCIHRFDSRMGFSLLPIRASGTGLEYKRANFQIWKSIVMIYQYISQHILIRL